MLLVLVEVFLDRWKLDIRNDYAAYANQILPGNSILQGDLRNVCLVEPQCTETWVGMENIGMTPIPLAVSMADLVIDVDPSL